MNLKIEIKLTRRSDDDALFSNTVGGYYFVVHDKQLLLVMRHDEGGVERVYSQPIQNESEGIKIGLVQLTRFIQG